MTNNDLVNVEFINEIFKNKINIGVDSKQLVYSHMAKELCYDNIDFVNMMQQKFNTTNQNSNCIVINIEKDRHRYDSAVDELKKISVTNFIHLKATYWKEKDKFVNDMNLVLQFLKQFDSNIPDGEMTMNIFSECNDKNILIQDGPLACYCSHVRSLMYGYMNFENYVVVIEDDVMIANTQKIEKYLKIIPDDWDIILMNAVPIGMTYESDFYKMKSGFHTTHFYIVKLTCLPVIFSSIYPIDDQIDILLSRLHDRLNIYNITGTMYQKNYSSNTQNNLYVLFNSIGYHLLRVNLTQIKNCLIGIFNKQINDSLYFRTDKIIDQIISDSIYYYIIHNMNSEMSDNIQDFVDEYELWSYMESHFGDNEYYKTIYHHLYVLMNCCVKGQNIHDRTSGLINNMLHIIKCFDLHNVIDEEYNEPMLAYSYGSSANVYLLKNNNIIVKVYDDKLRWTHKNHEDIDEVYNKELNILSKMNMIKSYNINKKIIKTEYLGESLYDNFVLPSDWKSQLRQLFDKLDEHHIYYPEFNLRNITVLNDKLSLIDFGLALNNSTQSNNNNYHVFTELLEKIQSKDFNKYSTDEKYMMYSTFINNLKFSGLYNDNIF